MLSYNFVAFAKCGNEAVVLKIGVPRDELTSEIAALRLFHGEGACRLIHADEERGFLLLERLYPGEMLAEMKDDEEATHIAADVMQKIWRPMESVNSLAPPTIIIPAAKRSGRAGVLSNAQKQAPGVQSFIQLTDWFDGLKKLRPHYNGGMGPFNKKLVERVERSTKDFFAENHQPVLMHGDFHHYNILSSERGWLIIDPKGVIGPACYEVGPLLTNPWSDLIKMKDYRGLTKRRIDILHERLGFERERIREWGLAHAILSAWWSVEDNTGEEYALEFAEMIAQLEL
jgi:streptomycin 6-kinase